MATSFAFLAVPRGSFRVFRFPVKDWERTFFPYRFRIVFYRVCVCTFFFFRTECGKNPSRARPTHDVPAQVKCAARVYETAGGYRRYGNKIIGNVLLRRFTTNKNNGIRL